ncbi:hypothetical protein NBRC116188_16480 [Oceaniserpentilla sp. 4NH20-0058]|uniref:hypothetical protein n=1 Tax=Oceaniserpentilla sp. 4NH20-0058 TaxID=3127660 RepID=UPI00310BA165
MKIKDAKVYDLCEVAKLAQADIQAKYPNVDPIIGISHQLRKAGFAADTLTIENPLNDTRIIMVLHDNKVEIVDYEFGRISQDPSFNFTEIKLSELTQQRLFEMMQNALVSPLN